MGAYEELLASDPEPIARLCVRIEDLKRPVAGSLIKDCSLCRKQCWYDPRASIPGTLHRERIVCEHCLPAYVEANR